MAKKLQKEKLGKSMLERKLERKNKKKRTNPLCSQVAAPLKLLSTHLSFRPPTEK
jgi:hypothetical protein